MNYDTVAPASSDDAVMTVFVSSNLDVPMQQVLFKRDGNLVENIQTRMKCNVELHTTAYFIRQVLESEALEKVHEQLIFACDEIGSFKGLDFNERACFITGIRVVGDCYFFMDCEDARQRDMLLTTLERILSTAKKSDTGKEVVRQSLLCF